MITNVSTTRRKRGAGYLDERSELIALSKLRRPDAVALFHFLINTGLRISEALIVHVEDIERGSTTLIGKGGRVRTVYYRADLIEKMREYLLDRSPRAGQDSELLFPFSRKTAHRILSPAGVWPHLLRHTYLTRLLRRTGDIRLVQEVAGHADIRTTSRYTHFTPQEIEAAMTEPRTLYERVAGILGRRRVSRRRLDPPERSFDRSPLHHRFVVYGRKGTGKTHMIGNTWREAHRIEWKTKGQVTKEIDGLRESGQLGEGRALVLEFGTPTATKMLYAESLEIEGLELVAEFRVRNERDEKQLLSTLFEFQPLRVDDMRPDEARQYLRHLCSVSRAQYSKVRELLDISTNPLFLKENLFRRRGEIRMSSTPVTFGWLFVLLALTFMVGRYWSMGRESYAIVTGLYFIIRMLRRF